MRWSVTPFVLGAPVECYRFIFKNFNENQSLKVTANMNTSIDHHMYYCMLSIKCLHDTYIIIISY